MFESNVNKNCTTFQNFDHFLCSYKTKIVPHWYQVVSVTYWLIFHSCILDVAGPILAGALRPNNVLSRFWYHVMEFDFVTRGTTLFETTEMCIRVKERVWHVYVIRRHTLQDGKFSFTIFSGYTFNIYSRGHVRWSSLLAIKLINVQLQFN